jgi:TatD DNase family protein
LQKLLFDAHIHLTDNEYYCYIQQILNNLRALKINACSVTVNIETTLRSIELFSNSNSDVVTQFIGIHPEFADTEDVTKFIEIFTDNVESIDGIGEIGLDRTYTEYNKSSYENQKEVFESMLRLAEMTKKPVSIHSRRSLDDILDILNTYNIENVLLHWFAGSKKQLSKSMDMGLYVSFGPVLIYSDDKKTILKNTDRDKFLVETDGPVKYSRCFKGLTSLSSSFLVSIVSCAANVLGMTYDETKDILKRNSESFLKRPI